MRFSVLMDAQTRLITKHPLMLSHAKLEQLSAALRLATHNAPHSDYGCCHAERARMSERLRVLGRDLDRHWAGMDGTWQHLLLQKALEVLYDYHCLWTYEDDGEQIWEACVMLSKLGFSAPDMPPPQADVMGAKPHV